MKSQRKIKVPAAMKVQLARLFGEKSREASKEYMSPTEYKVTLRKVLGELFNYMEENIDTDGMHFLMLCSGLSAADNALKDNDFWPGYIEGITRFAFLLMGDYPNHRLRKGGKKKKEHYNLKRLRTNVYVQDTDQRIRTMITASQLKVPRLTQDPQVALRQFRNEKGFSATYKEFLRWFKENYPADYAALF
jgi:hypothetical protein